ncbi:HAD hydrolase-like protein [Sphingomonas sp. BGYR3]|uniref:HAD hydrolase-like protein n=1 Tax=Sphingomonas sp. BGYR3 TaxID=2975483 RepID=UPI0021A736B2|nr:HAD hydrolase-like protein [Sphingomonas sp. BGYR3]MDG5488038.1 HAD hydrolase-like protein [Sphingomonas sp. BGYR3]
MSDGEAPIAPAILADPADPICRLAIFDFDGTLSDSGTWFLSIVDELADRFGFRHVSPEEIETLRGRTTREVIRAVGISRWRLPAIARYVQARFAENAHRIELFPGVSDMLAQVHDAGIRIAICTSNTEANAKAVLGPDNVALVEHFECGASLFGKARKFRRLMRKLNVRPDEALSVGDETRDVTAARKAGVRCGAVLWGYANPGILGAMHPDWLFTGPDHVVRTILGR